MKWGLCLAIGFAIQLHAQNVPWPVVHVTTIDSEAREISPLLDIPENPSAFRVTRSGGTNMPLRVSVRFSGTASNGVDYQFLSNSVTIPAGSWVTDVFVSVQDDEVAEGTETVVLTLVPTPCPECYVIGSNSTAVAHILDNEATNSPPTVWISRPRDGETFRGPTNILLRAVAHDAQDGYDIAVEFFAGPNRIGAATFIPSLCPAVDCPSWDLVWSNAPPGHYTLTAKATDQTGALTVSAPVHITVSPTNPPPVERTIVSVVALNPNTSEPDAGMVAAGLFGIRRTGNLHAAIPVFVSLTGSAVNGVDYNFVSNRVVIPAGSTQTVVNIFPMSDGLVEGTETVGLTIEPVACPPIFPPAPECYEIGAPGVAEVFIRDAFVTNHPPRVQLNSPVEGEVFHSPANIVFRAFAQDTENGHQIRVEFFAGTNSLGFGEFVPTLCPAPWCPFFALVWSNAPPGHHTLTARATDQVGATTVSAPVHITVRETNPPPERTIVSVTAVDSQATEVSIIAAIDAGRFAIHRTGNLHAAIPVLFKLSGTASNGVDYAFVSNRVTIPAGSTQAFVNINPRFDNAAEGTETAVLTIEPLLCIAIFPPPPECYEIDGFGHATVFIHDGPVVTNHAPTVQINEPSDGSEFASPTNIVLRAYAQDAEDSHQLTVEFFAGTNHLGVGEFVPARCATPFCPYFELTWSNVPPGAYTLTAKATDSAGLTAISAPVHIFVKAETNPPPVEHTVVTVVATDATAREPALGAIDSGQFAIRRNGNLSNDVTVFFALTGSASNGADYVIISNRVFIAAGATQALVNVVPLSDALLEGTETVVLELRPPVCAAVFPPPPGCYVVGAPGRATVFIDDASAPTNRPPMVKLLNPLDGSLFPAPVNILLLANANDPDGRETLSRVEFFEGSNSLGIRTNYPTADPLGPFFLIWRNVAAGEYKLTARATDTAGASTVSPAVTITVLNMTNQPPRPRPWPRLFIPPQCLAEVRTNGCRLLLEADTPMTCVIESSVDLIQWTPIYTNTLSGGAVEFRDSEGGVAPLRFYRARQE